MAGSEHGGERDIWLPSGAIHVRIRGDQDLPLAVCVHGLSANHHGFDEIAPAIAQAGYRVAALDLRGRGRSRGTGPGTYGLPAHAADVVGLADVLGAERFSVVGWSLGALIGMQVAASHPSRVDRLVMIDHAHREDEAAVGLIVRGLARLDRVFPSPDAYADAMRVAGVAVPWSDMWNRFYRYELKAVDGGVKPVTSRAAAEENLAYLDAHDLSVELWPRLKLPVLLVRATVPIGGGLIVPAEERDAFAAAVPGLQVVEVPANHYGVMTNAPSIAAMCGFLISGSTRNDAERPQMIGPESEDHPQARPPTARKDSLLTDLPGTSPRYRPSLLLVVIALARRGSCLLGGTGGVSEAAVLSRVNWNPCTGAMRKCAKGAMPGIAGIAVEMVTVIRRESRRACPNCEDNRGQSRERELTELPHVYALIKNCGCVTAI